jgi:hypothetical protein
MQAGCRRTVSRKVQLSAGERTFQPDFETHLNLPFLKGSLGSLQTSKDTSAFVRWPSTDGVVGRIGDSLNGETTGRMYSLTTRPSHIPCIIWKTCIMHHRKSHQGVEPPLPALLAEPEPGRSRQMESCSPSRGTGRRDKMDQPIPMPMPMPMPPQDTLAMVWISDNS